MMKVALALLAATLLLAGCTKPSDEGSTPEQDSEGRYVIHMTANNRYAPAEAKVPVGATVIWVIDGGVHDVTAHDESWKSPRFMSAGATYEHTFTEAGDYDYHCELHASAGMAGTVHVKGDGPTGGAGTGTATGTGGAAGTATTAATQTTASTQTATSTMTTTSH